MDRDHSPADNHAPRQQSTAVILVWAALAVVITVAVVCAVALVLLLETQAEENRVRSAPLLSAAYA
ncbi:hypothetical protein [Streptomyces sp. NPDC020965]|uniref:hypothetical protein n=1 Tax=Streptomyces sp. NPDC020965 TaxID=3365105 RepID=UPI0037A36DF8